MKRTTLVLDEKQFIELRKLAVAEGRTLSAITEELLRIGLATRRRRKRQNRPRLLTANMGKFKVDIADREAVYDAMDDR